MPRGRVHWLILVPIALIVAASMMFVQKHQRERAESQAAAAALAAAPPADASRPEQPRDAFRRGMAALLQRQPKPALAIFEAIRDEPLRLAGQAMSQHDMRHAAESQLALETLRANFGDIAPYQVAQVYAWRGQTEEAFQWLDRAVVQRDGGLADVQYDPAFRSLRTDPRYAALLDRLGPPR